LNITATERNDEEIRLFNFYNLLFAAFAAAQKTVRKRPKQPSVQTSEQQTSSDAGQHSNQKESNQNNQNQLKSNQFDTPLKILDKPRASYPTNGGCFQGKVVLRVTFLDSGEIGKISIISGLGNGATENAIEAAKKIKFIPAIKDGTPVSVTKPVEYVFSIY
jgi:TonB family protein